MSEMDTTQKHLCDCAVQIHSPYAAGGAGSSDTTAVIRLGSGTRCAGAGKEHVTEAGVAAVDPSHRSEGDQLNAQIHGRVHGHACFCSSSFIDLVRGASLELHNTYLSKSDEGGEPVGPLDG